MNKYKNTKITYDGHKFDSQKEKKYYVLLKASQDRGEITGLELQKEFVLQDSFKLNGKTIRKISYYSDFYYVDRQGISHVVDVKGYRTEIYLLKKKLFEFKYQKEIEEV